MAQHSKRAMAQKKANKERQAGFHGRRRKEKENYKNKNSHGRSNQNQSQNNQQQQTRNRPYSSIYDEPDPLDRQLFDYIIVVDVEATCERDNNKYPHEIIELPAVLIDVRRGIVDKKRSFRSYVKPWRNPILSEFCISLTGITQADVDSAPGLPEVIKNFEAWYLNTIPVGAKVVFAADGPWDFKSFIHEHSILRDHVSFPSIFYEYLDIRTTFAHHFNRGAPMKLDNMLRRMRLKFEGRPHCGFDDAVNIARLAIAMMRAGCIFDFLIAIPLEDTFHYNLPGVPLYRREEGSGRLDPDIVDDIAKREYGIEFFQFGDRQRREVRRYRGALMRNKEGKLLLLDNNNSNNNNNWSVRVRLGVLMLLVILISIMLGAVVYTRVTRWYWGSLLEKK